MTAGSAGQFDLFRTEGGVLVVVVQSDLLDGLRTRVVAPLLPASDALRGMRGLNPEISFAGEVFMLAPQLAATLTVAELGVRVGAVSDHRDAVIRAVDILLSGV